MRWLPWLCLLSACAGSGAPTPDRATSAPSVPEQGLVSARARNPALRQVAGQDANELPLLEAGPRSSAAAVASASSESAASSPPSSTSLGSPTNGRLEGGVALPMRAAGLRFNDRRDADARFATAEVIAAIERAAALVRVRFADSELVVNDLSLPAGGSIPHHGSHRAGRDADILFYLNGDDGAATPSVGAPLDRDGVGFDFKDLAVPADDVRVHFDAQRTWLFVAALLEDSAAQVQRVFVAEHLRDQLLTAARAAHASPATVALFEDVSCQPSYPHDDHLHVRWFCSFEDLGKGCEDLPPLYPWREAALAEAGLKPVLAGRTRALDPAPITSQAAAAREVRRQKPDAKVLAFLARRKAWEKQPHPGRPYCR